ncbi:hypothetical protein PPYR_15141 [Photinus pyralis]|uniref:Cwf18 pre-mRNA splicing factor n=1 Tax=Photinus pyralis TaxID=7054 RepID=A0A1Y1MRV0_PHOPY|nr:coiled-coil domain-containing protein 12 [Photinus pyralis]KAB0790452.1 hypothetical protein PPYR_15141 [Photinus pyralis]
MSDVNVGSLEEIALKRKEKLQALKRKREGNEEHNSVPTNTQTVLPKPKFRSYKPEDEKLNEHKLEDAKPGDVEAEVKDQLSLGKSQVIIDELDITNLAPRKPDWDLKRDVAKKLEKLERRTQRAIAELIRDRLKERETYIS